MMLIVPVVGFSAPFLKSDLVGPVRMTALISHVTHSPPDEPTATKAARSAAPIALS